MNTVTVFCVCAFACAVAIVVGFAIGYAMGRCECVTIMPRSYALIRTGISAQPPKGYELQVRPRSGLQCKKGIVGAFGTVDNGYRGDIGVALYNHTDEPQVAHRHDENQRGYDARPAPVQALWEGASMMKPLTCGRCPKWKNELGGLCVHYATTFPPYRPLCKYGKRFIHNEQSRLAMEKMRSRKIKAKRTTA